MIGTNTSHLIAGRILICDGMEWRAVCQGGWDREDATVVCRQLGFPAAGKPSSNVEVYISIRKYSLSESQAKNKSAQRVCIPWSAHASTVNCRH